MVHARMLGSYPLDRLALLNVAVVLSVVYVRLVIGRARAGWARLLTAAPLFLLNAVLPFLFDPVPEFVCRACSFLLLTWVANFKVRIPYSTSQLQKLHVLARFLKKHYRERQPLSSGVVCCSSDTFSMLRDQLMTALGFVL